MLIRLRFTADIPVVNSGFFNVVGRKKSVLLLYFILFPQYNCNHFIFLISVTYLVDLFSQKHMQISYTSVPSIIIMNEQCSDYLN